LDVGWATGLGACLLAALAALVLADGLARGRAVAAGRLLVAHQAVTLGLVLAAMCALGRARELWASVYPRYAAFSCLFFAGLAAYAVEVAPRRLRGAVAVAFVALAAACYGRADGPARAM